MTEPPFETIRALLTEEGVDRINIRVGRRSPDGHPEVYHVTAISGDPNSPMGLGVLAGLPSAIARCADSFRRKGEARTKDEDILG